METKHKILAPHDSILLSSLSMREADDASKSWGSLASKGGVGLDDRRQHRARWRVRGWSQGRWQRDGESWKWPASSHVRVVRAQARPEIRVVSCRATHRAERS
jgi:hypothetical protein